MISSSANARVKYVRRLQSDRRFRSREACFVAEGRRWVEDSLALGSRPIALYATAGEAAALPVGAEVILVSEGVMRAMSDTATPAGLLAVLPQPRPPLPSTVTLALILDQLRDPGNAGTMIRTAAAAGVDAVFLTPGSVDAFNPKTVRATMGALLRVPVHHADWDTIARCVAGCQVWVAAADGAVAYTTVDWRSPTALIIGGEADGASSAARRLAHGSVAIPMAANTESLNAAVAAGVLLFAAAHGRSASGAP